MNFRKILISFIFLSFSCLLSAKSPRYVFYFIGDGMGFNHVGAAMMYQSKNVADFSQSLVFTQFPVTGIVDTRSGSHYITDSSAGGTALATGSKAINHSLGLDVNAHPVQSIIMNAQEKKWSTGVVTSTSIDDATPASFYGHATDRNMYYEIGKQAASSGINFLGGAGFKSYTNKENKSDPNLLEIFPKNNYDVFRGIQAYNKTKSFKKNVVLIPDREYAGTALPYVIDRQEGDLTLWHLTTSAIEYFENTNAEKFMLVVEGGRIDHASHLNDGATMITELIDFAKSVQLAYDFYVKHPEETLIVLTADHETGGLALGRTGTVMQLQSLTSQKASLGKLSGMINNLHQLKPAGVQWEDVVALLTEQVGLWRDISVTAEDEEKLKVSYEQTFVTKTSKKIKTIYSIDEPMAVLAIEIINKYANTGWTTNNHSGAYVPVFAIGAGAEVFSGLIDNTDIPEKITQITGLKK
jgi:alkaline phosphatase